MMQKLVELQEIEKPSYSHRLLQPSEQLLKTRVHATSKGVRHLHTTASQLSIVDIQAIFHSRARALQQACEGQRTVCRISSFCAVGSRGWISRLGGNHPSIFSPLLYLIFNFCPLIANIKKHDSILYVGLRCSSLWSCSLRTL